MAALLADALAKEGVAALIFDFSGTGDSSGEFSNAAWERWIVDGVAACDWMASAHDVPVTAAGLRTGCLLALETAEKYDTIDKLVCWQPVLNGATFLNQFLRLRTAASLAGGSSGETTRALHEALTAGETLEIAGYELSPSLAESLEAARFPKLAAETSTTLDWLDVTADGTPSPASLTALETLTPQDSSIRHHVIEGPAFWSIQETTIVPALIGQTVSLITGRPS